MVGDINLNGRKDYFITGHPDSDRFVDDFLLIQGPDASFHVIASPSSPQKQIARVWPPIRGVLGQGDFNFDGYLDFLLSGIETSVSGVEDVIIVTQHDVGTTPVAAIPVDAAFTQLFEEILLAFTESAAFLDIWNDLACSTSVGVQLNYFSCNFTDGFLAFEGFALPSLMCGIENLYVQETCTTGQEKFSPEMQQVMNSFSSVITGGGVDCTSCISSGTAALSSNLPPGADVRSFAPAIPAIPAAYKVVVGVLAAGGVTTILVADDPADVGSLDVGRVAAMLGGYFMSRSTGGEGDWPTTDVWQIPPQCEPNDPYDLLSSIGKKYDSRRLRRNLNEAGCQCPDGAHTDAHHIVEKGNQMTPTHGILLACGIGIDDAVNGVCLPRNERIQTHANSEVVPHQALRIPAYRDAVAERVADAHNNGGCAAVRAELRSMAQELTSGQIPVAP